LPPRGTHFALLPAAEHPAHTGCTNESHCKGDETR
jgi:hypothetical protein